MNGPTRGRVGIHPTHAPPGVLASTDDVQVAYRHASWERKAGILRMCILWQMVRFAVINLKMLRMFSR